MCEQYLSGGTETLDHLCMGDGEEAVELFAKYRLVERSGRGGTWTLAGKALLALTWYCIAYRYRGS